MTPLSPEAIAEKLTAFIAKRSKLVALSEIGRETPIFSSGLLDSLAFIELVTFMESEFNVRLSDAAVVNFSTMDTLAPMAQLILNPTRWGTL